MRIVHIIAGLNQDGAQSVLYRLVSHGQTGDEHIVISMMDKGVYGPRMEGAGVGLHVLNMPRGRMTLSGLMKLYRLLQSLRPDVVQTWMYHADLIGGVIARLAGCTKVVWGVRHSDHHQGKTKGSTRAVATICSWISGVVPATIVSCSERAVSIHEALGYPAAKFRVIPNGYDLSQYAPDSGLGATSRRELGVPASVALVGFVGRWHPQKDHANLIKAVAMLAQESPELRCVLVGEGMESGNGALGRLIAGSGMAGRFILAGRRSDIPAIMNALDVHVLPSAFGEAFPNVVAEAMACGTPCVVTDVGDAAMIVDATGWVVPIADSKALADALRAALAQKSSNPVEWATRRDACRKRIVERFSLEKMGQAYRSVWQQLAVDIPTNTNE